MQNMQRVMALNNPKVLNVKIEDLADDRFVRKLDETGAIDRLYESYGSNRLRRMRQPDPVGDSLRNRRTTRSSGPALASLAPAAERGRSTHQDYSSAAVRRAGGGPVQMSFTNLGLERDCLPAALGIGARRR